MTLHSSQPRPALNRQWGAEPARAGLWRFSLFAPGARHVAVEVEGRRNPLVLRGDGFHRATAPAEAGESYRFHVDGRATPDPAARAQAGGIEGASVLVDPAAYPWQAHWAGRPWDDAVLLQLHVGTFTAEGTFAAAAPRMAALAETGITAIQLMPVTQTEGARGWGYADCLPFAPHAALGSPDDLRALVDAAHAAGLMVIHDLAWTSQRQGGAGLGQALPHLFRQGGGFDLSSIPARSLLIENALHWLAEYRMDGLRIDRPDLLADPQAPHLLTELAARLHAAGFTRPIHLLAGENPERPERFGAVWQGGWQDAVTRLLSGDAGAMAELRAELAAPRPHFTRIRYNQSHQSIAARPFCERLLRLADPRAAQVAHALLLSAPGVPMLMMGDEAGERAPFHVFADLSGAGADALRASRRALFGDLPDLSDLIPDPMDRTTFALSRPYRRDGPEAAGWRALTAGLLRFRADETLPLLRSGPAAPPEAQVTGPLSLLASWPCRAGTLHVAANFGGLPDVEPPVFLRPPKLALCHVARDRYAFALWLERPRRA
jgi:1,4-alpha-glucan branching enzyme